MNEGTVRTGYIKPWKKSGRANFIGPAFEARKILDRYF